MHSNSQNAIRTRILEILMSDSDRFFSGQELSSMLGVTRAAVWKHIKFLEREGMTFEAVTNKGYRLTGLSDSLSPELIESHISTHWLGKKLHCFDETESTNRAAKKMAAQGCPGGVAVIADTQTQGRGRRERVWHSEPGCGACISVVLRTQVAPKYAPRFTIAAAVGVRRMLKHFGVDALIKWPNDVLCGGKKLSGILLEMGASMESVDYIVVGIGLNINNMSFPEEVASIATSMREQAGREIKRYEVVGRLLSELEPVFESCETDEGFWGLLAEYRAFSSTLHQRVCISGLNETYTGVAEDFDELGRLLLKMEDGSVHAIDSGDVSLRSNA